MPQGAYPTLDGWVNIAAISADHWIALCKALGRPEWSDDARWRRRDDRHRNRESLQAAIGSETAKQTSAYWVDLLDRIGLPCGPIYTMDEVFADPQVQHLGVATPVTHPRLGQVNLLASPLNIKGHDKAIASAAKSAAEDTGDVLKWVGYSDAEIAALAKSGAI
jgi:formyl-CoA transferase